MKKVYLQKLNKTAKKAIRIITKEHRLLKGIILRKIYEKAS